MRCRPLAKSLSRWQTNPLGSALRSGRDTDETGTVSFLVPPFPRRPASEGSLPCQTHGGNRRARRDASKGLVDYDAVKIRSNVRMQGLFLKQGELVGMVDPESGAEQLDHLEDEREFDTSEVERSVTSPDSNHKILEEIKKHALEHEKRYGRFPKTLIFAANDIPHISHADAVAALAVEVFGRGESFVRKITGRSDRPLQLIREFRNRAQPDVVVTVDLLSTGVDIPDLEFIVFLRPVKSRILLEQMLGRGTRKGGKVPRQVALYRL